jgi:hypothetical protein
MPVLRKKPAMWSLLFLSVSTTTAATAQQMAPAEQMCRPEQLSGQYECVASAPLSEEEVRVSLAYLAALRTLALPAPNDEERSMPNVLAARTQGCWREADGERPEGRTICSHP